MMQRNTGWHTTLGLLLVSLFALVVAGCLEPPEGAAAIGRQMPEFSLTTLDGETIDSSALAGDQPVVLNLWATWCGPCVREIPDLIELHRSGTARVISIAIDDDGADVVRPFAAEHGIDYPVLIGDPSLLKQFGSRSIPFTLVLDGDLTVRSIFRSMVRKRTLDRQIAKIESAEPS